MPCWGVTDPKKGHCASLEPSLSTGARLFVFSTDFGLGAAESSSPRPHPDRLLAAAPESRPADSSAPGRNRLGRNGRQGFYGEMNLYACCCDTERRERVGVGPN